MPILVAVNKIDKEGADPTRVRTEMTQRGLQPAEWGGDTEFVDVSAKTHAAASTTCSRRSSSSPSSRSSRPTPTRRPAASSSSPSSTRAAAPSSPCSSSAARCEVGDALVAGAHWGKVRAMVDYNGRPRRPTAVPGDPVEVLGFDGVPDAGDTFRVVENDRTARQQANERAVRLRNEAQARRSGRKVSFEDVFKRHPGGRRPGARPRRSRPTSSGSLEAFEDEIAKLPAGRGPGQRHPHRRRRHHRVRRHARRRLRRGHPRLQRPPGRRRPRRGRARGRGDPRATRSSTTRSTTCATPCRACSSPRRSRRPSAPSRSARRSAPRGSAPSPAATSPTARSRAARKVRIVRDGTVIYDDDDRLAQALQRRRPRGRRGLRVRHRRWPTTRTSRRATSSRCTRPGRSSGS